MVSTTTLDLFTFSLIWKSIHYQNHDFQIHNFFGHVLLTDGDGDGDGDGEGEGDDDGDGDGDDGMPGQVAARRKGISINRPCLLLYQSITHATYSDMFQK